MTYCAIQHAVQHLQHHQKKPCASPCTLNMSPLDQHMVRKLSSAAAQGTACRDEPESVRRKQGFRPEQGRALWQPKDTLHTYEWHICRKVQAPASQGYACWDEQQVVGTDMRAASFHSDLCRKPCCMPYRVEPGRLCQHGRPCKLQMEGQQDGMALACCAGCSTMVHCAVQHAIQHAIQHCQYHQQSLVAAHAH
jgi:hypothetical protein